MGEDQQEKIPTVFISYSHDSPQHKNWVAELAAKLVDKGIDVTLDRWDLKRGGDVPKYMERSVTWADRVLMICTEAYVRKADEGRGGVGYEAMIVTGELVKDLGTDKFIPIIHQNNGGKEVPRFMATRFYVNLSEGEKFDEEFEELLRELHNEPALKNLQLEKILSPKLLLAMKAEQSWRQLRYPILSHYRMKVRSLIRKRLKSPVRATL